MFLLKSHMQSVREIYNTYEELKPATPIGWAKEAWGIYNTYEELKQEVMKGKTLMLS